MRLILACVLAVLVSAAPAAAQDPKSEDEKVLYAIGLAFSQNLSWFSLSEAELKMVEQGLRDGVLNKPKKVELQTYGPKIQDLQRARMSTLAANEKKAGQAYLTKAAGEKDAKKTASGLIITTLRPGTGGSPAATDRVKVHYHGTLTDGTVFDSSVQRNEPVTFGLNQVVPCWTEGVQQMKVGGKSRLVCPAEIAYGDRGAPPRIKPGATLVFEVELLEIVKDGPGGPPAGAAPKR
ncbi:MAG: FKBP-type peptidyl-prolyl cis-trans isomerase [Candidatus Rokubacteria bacterium]|nr:FKBP-type peptidyl-prolyl cis-trans isomerase [Candidatus Rokubacteria bacterium]